MDLNPKEEKLKEDIQRILKDLEVLQKDRTEAGEIREDISQDVDKIIEHVQGIVKEVSETGDDVEDIKEDVEEIKKEIDETGDDVEEIKEDVEDIKKEIDETGEDVEDIKEDIEVIRKDLSELKEEAKKPGIMSRVAHKVIPDQFAVKDVAQQIVGAVILSAPFVVTGEVWELANKLSEGHLIAIILITLTFDILLYYFAKFKDFEEKRLGSMALRVLSLLTVTYATSAIVLTTFGIIGGVITDPVWAAKLIVMVGLFANIGAGTADLIK